MAQKVRLILNGSQKDSSGEDTFTASETPAEYYEKNGSIFLFFTETSEGAKSAVKSRIKYKNGLLELTRNGMINTHMVFEKGREYLTDYATPYGCLKLGILTHALSCTVRDGLPEIRADYSLTCEGQRIARCRIEILATKTLDVT